MTVETRPHRHSSGTKDSDAVPSALPEPSHPPGSHDRSPEWTGTPGTRASQPVHIRLKGGGLFAFAGIYAERRDGQDTYAIVTTEPNELVAPIHNRMPVILDPADEALWLDSAVTDPLAVLGCLRPSPPHDMEAYAVGPLVSSAWNEGPELVQPLVPRATQASLGLLDPCSDSGLPAPSGRNPTGGPSLRRPRHRSPELTAESRRS